MTGENDEDHAAAVFFNITAAEYLSTKLATQNSNIRSLESDEGLERQAKV